MNSFNTSFQSVHSFAINLIRVIRIFLILLLCVMTRSHSTKELYDSSFFTIQSFLFCVYFNSSFSFIFKRFHRSFIFHMQQISIITWCRLSMYTFSVNACTIFENFDSFENEKSFASFSSSNSCDTSSSNSCDTFSSNFCDIFSSIESWKTMLTFDFLDCAKIVSTMFYHIY